MTHITSSCTCAYSFPSSPYQLKPRSDPDSISSPETGVILRSLNLNSLLNLLPKPKHSLPYCKPLNLGPY